MLRFDYGRMRQWAPMLMVIQTMMGPGWRCCTVSSTPMSRRDPGALHHDRGTDAGAHTPRLRDAPGSGRPAEDRGDLRLHLVAARHPAAPRRRPRSCSTRSSPCPARRWRCSWRRGGTACTCRFSPLLVPAAVLCALMAITVGYGMAVAISNPLVTNVVTNAFDVRRADVLPHRVSRVAAAGLALRRPPGACPSTTWPSSSGPASPPASWPRGHVVRRPGGLDRCRWRGYGLGRGAPALVPLTRPSPTACRLT